MALDDLKFLIKERPISSIIGHYLDLKPQGKNFLALCPFHNDRNPSMHVNDSKNMFMCFSCSTGGDAISFVEKYRNLDFTDALREISDILGLTFEDYQNKKTSPEHELAQKVLHKVVQLYTKCAKGPMKDQYQAFLNQRNIKKEIAEKFQLGIVPGTNVVTGYLGSIKDPNEKQKAIKQALELGILREDKNRKGRYYDFFRRRLMIPIQTAYGQPVGLAGRDLTGESKSKYVNSPESNIFKKENILFALNHAKGAIRSSGQIILVEGQFDAIMLHQHGFEQTVAVMGTGFGKYAISQIKQHAKTVYLCMDNDAAGMKAMGRINEALLKEGIIARRIHLAPHKDPDEYLNAEGAISFQQKIDQATVFLDDQVEESIGEKVPELTDDKLRLLFQVFGLLLPLEDRLEATERAVNFAKRIGLRSEPAQIIDQYKKFLTDTPEKRRQQFEQARHQQQTPEKLPAQLAPRVEDNSINKLESRLVSELTQHPESLTHPTTTELLDFVMSNDVKEYIIRLKSLLDEVDEDGYTQLVWSILDSSPSFAKIKECVAPALYQFKPTQLNEVVVEKLLADFKKKLQEEELKRERDLLKQKQKKCIDAEDAKQLMRDILEIERKLTQLKK